MTEPTADRVHSQLCAAVNKETCGCEQPNAPTEDNGDEKCICQREGKPRVEHWSQCPVFKVPAPSPAEKDGGPYEMVEGPEGKYTLEGPGWPPETAMVGLREMFNMVYAKGMAQGLSRGAEDLAEAVNLCKKALAELRWCSGSPDFNPGGQARVGWMKGPVPVMEALSALIARLEGK